MPKMQRWDNMLYGNSAKLDTKYKVGKNLLE